MWGHAPRQSKSLKTHLVSGCFVIITFQAGVLLYIAYSCTQGDVNAIKFVSNYDKYLSNTHMVMGWSETKE